MGDGQLRLRDCAVEAAGEEGVVVMDRAAAALDGVAISGCGGPGVDASDSATVKIAAGSCKLEAGAGGRLWLWDDASAAGFV